MSSYEKPNKGKSDTWLTPLEIVNKLGEFDLDPCGFRYHPTARNHFYENGLTKKWYGRVWLNPPYSEVGSWLEKLENHGRGIALVFARTDTKWAQAMLPKATSVFFLSKRIKFLKSDFTAPPWTCGAPSMFLSFGEKPLWPFEGWEAK